MPKRSVRRSVLDVREKLTAQQVECWSLHLQERLLKSPLFASASTVALYSPIRQEVRTDSIAAAAWGEGKEVLYPAVAGDGMVFRRVESERELSSGAYGIREPGTGCPEIPAEQADIIVVPGVAFDRYGRRIGYGKGYYDKALHRLEGKGRLVGFGYSFQLLDEIAGEPHDVLLDFVVTEKEFIDTRSHSKTGGTDR